MIEEFNSCIKNGLNGLLAVVAALIGVLIALTIYRRNKTREYRKQLFEAFQPDLNRLLQTNDDCRLFLTDEALTRHETAVNNLMIHMDYIERHCLKRKWYCLAMVKMDKDHYMPDYSQYADCGSLDKRREIRPLVIKRLQAVIAFGRK